MNKELDYSKLSAVEVNAISTVHENLINHTDNSPYPYFSAVIGALSELFIGYPAERAGALKIFYDELTVISRHLLSLSPRLPSLDPNELVNLVTNDALIDGILKMGMINTLVKDLQAIQKVVETRIAMIERSANTGTYYETH